MHHRSTILKTLVFLECKAAIIMVNAAFATCITYCVKLFTAVSVSQRELCKNLIKFNCNLLFGY